MTNDPSNLGLIRVEAGNYREALQKISERFGRDVSIISTRQVKRKGVMGVFGTTGVEVYVTTRARHEEFLDDRANRERESALAPRGARGAQAAQAAAAAPSAPTADELGRMLKTLETQVQSLLGSAPPAARPSRATATRGTGASAAASATAAANAARAANPIVEAAAALVERAGIGAEAGEEILERIARRRVPAGIDRGAQEASAIARRHVAELCRAKIPPCTPIQPRAAAAGPHVVALVGPTGVGKTTTIAKLASLFHLVERKKVALLTLDTYRIGAVDQLRKFSEIMQVPLTVVGPGDGVAPAIARHRDCDLVFIDTAGRGQRDAERLADVGGLLHGVGSLEVHLCVSLTTAKDTIVEVAKNFRAVPYHRVVITKLDEAVRRGVLLDLFQAAKAPVSYITCGQEVPQDIQPASVERLEGLLLGDE